jgi:hypothetical protein
MQVPKGRIGVARRVHWLDGLSEYEGWGSSACKKWCGRVEIVSESEPVTCSDCARLDPEKIEFKYLE